MQYIPFILLLTPLAHLIVYGKFFNPNITTPLFALVVLMIISSVWFLGVYLISAKNRAYILERWHHMYKKPLVLSLFGFFAVQCVSLLFAFDSSFAWWGHPMRWGGVLTTTIFFTLFLLMTLLFTQKDWKRFSIIALCMTIAMLIGEFVDIAHGFDRPESFTGNPIFLSQIFLFGFWVCYEATKNLLLTTRKIILWIVGFLLLLGILLTRSRGILLALGISGVLTVLVWFFSIVQQKGYEEKKRVYKKIGIVLISIGVVFLTLQFSTGGKVWSYIPAVDRLVSTTQTDDTVRSRLSTYKTSLQIMDPRQNSVVRELFGWGNDNYQFAWVRHYDPKVYRYEHAIFDRSHNILLDILVMNGIVGLAVFLLLLYFLYRAVFSLRKHHSAELLVLFFIFTTYLLQAMTAPDGIGAQYYLYIFLAYLSYKTLYSYETK